MRSWGFALREGVFAETKEGICRNQIKRKRKRERKMADAHRARRCIFALAVLLQAQEFPAGNPAAAAGSVAKAGDGEIGRKGPEGEREGNSRKVFWEEYMDGRILCSSSEINLEQSPPSTLTCPS